MNIDTGFDVAGISTASGSLAQNWDYLGGANQLWSITTVANATTAVTGRVALEGVDALSAVSAAAPLGSFLIEFRLPGTKTVIRTVAVSLTPVSGSPYGAFRIPSVVTGIYDVTIKGSKNLRVLLPKVTIAPNSPLPDQVLPGGDGNNDNSVDSSDFGLLIGAFNSDASLPGTGYDPAADFNYDGAVDSSDFSILISEFNNLGAQ